MLVFAILEPRPDVPPVFLDFKELFLRLDFIVAALLLLSTDCSSYAAFDASAPLCFSESLDFLVGVLSPDDGNVTVMLPYALSCLAIGVSFTPCRRLVDRDESRLVPSRPRCLRSASKVAKGSSSSALCY